MTRRYFFKTFRRLDRMGRWYRSRVTPGGKLLITCLLAGALFGVDFRKSLSYQIFSMALALAVVAIVGTWMARGRFTVQRTLPPFVTVGIPAHYTVRVCNETGKGYAGVRLREAASADFPTFEEFLRIREPGHDTRNRFDRYVGYPRWRWVAQRRQGISTDEVALGILPGHESLVSDLCVTATRRGRIELPAVQVLVPEPLGLFRKAFEVSALGVLLALPSPLPMPPLELASGRRRRALASIDRTSLGGVEELRGLREYRSGDPLRYVDWRATARLGEPMVKEFHDEHTGGVTVYLDTDSDLYGDEFEAAVIVAASLINASLGAEPAKLVMVRSLQGVKPLEEAPGAVHVSSTRTDDVTPAPEGTYALERANARERAMTMLASIEASPGCASRQVGLIEQRFSADTVIAILLGNDASRLAIVDALRRRAQGEVFVLQIVAADEPDVPSDVAVVRVNNVGAGLRAFAKRHSSSGKSAA
ncbi:MAG: hypothetical protein ACI8PT_003398 [Gammaproteobacteria bacterium]|jgi:uncharacterized protein (DUF58 family)